MDSIKLQINDQEVEAEATQTIMEAADGAGVYIPRLCSHPQLKPSGSCRLCAVEIEGQRGLPAACSTPVMNGMKVWTKTPKVLDFRREMLRLILQEHPRECLGCPRNGTCELQRLVEHVGIDFPYAPPTEKRPPAETVGTCFERDMSLCVRCGRCVRVCHEVRGARAIVFRERAGHQEVSTPLGRTLLESGCQMCGACVDVCPVGALRDRREPQIEEGRAHTVEVCESLARMVMDLFRKESSRTWKQSFCTICSANCRMSFELAESGRILQSRPVPPSRAHHGQACVQGRFFLKDYLQRSNRLTNPLVQLNGSYQEQDWETVLPHLAERLQGYGAWETAVFTDAALTTEELFQLQRFARTVLKTNLVGCLSPTGHVTLEESLGRAPETHTFRGSLSDLGSAGCVLAIGVNPPATHPIAGTMLRKAVLEGTKFVVMNPLSVGIGRYADVHLQHYPGTELIVLAGLAHLMLHEHGAGSAPGMERGGDRDVLLDNLAPYGPEAVAQLTGVSAEVLVEAACLLKSHSPLTVLYGPGMAQTAEARDSVQGMVTLLQLTDSLSATGGGLIPLFGRGNQRGASDLGLLSPLFETATNGSRGAARPHSSIGELLGTGQVKAVLLAFDSLESRLFETVQPYLGGLELVVLHDTLPPFNGDPAGHPPVQVILPMASALEKEGTYTGVDGKPLPITPIRSAPGKAKSVLWLLQELARHMKAAGFAAENDEALRKEIWEQISAATTLVRKTPKQAADCCCCGPGSGGGSTNGCPKSPAPWKPALAGLPSSLPSQEFPLQVVPKEALEPYFIGPLQARESQAVFYPDGEVEMNPADAFQLELSPGDPVRVVSAAAEWEGRMAQNPLLAAGMVSIPLSLYQSQVKDMNAETRMMAARIEKKAQGSPAGSDAP